MAESKFWVGDHVRIKIDGVYYYGEITIVKKDGTCKVMFGAAGPNYDYYPESELELIREEDTDED